LGANVFLLFFVAVISLLVPDAISENKNSENKKSPSRPKIGLVLEGGGALGFAHVGVLKVLEENRIPVHMIAGTSMGSIVGAAYASGQPLEVIHEVCTTTNWDSLFDENPPRSELPFRLKPGREREIYGSAKIGTRGGQLTVPLAFVAGQNILPVFQRLYENVPTPVNFDDLPIPYRAVAADIETGKAVILKEGNLALAARASMAVPGFFSPVEIDGKLLVDGGIAMNFPVEVVLDMGADVLIAVDFNPPLRKREELQNPIAISGQILAMILAQNKIASRKLLRKKDVLIVPDTTGFSSSSFSGAEAIIERGETAARAVVSELKKLSVSEKEYEAYQQARIVQSAPPPTIDLVTVDNSSNVPTKKIKALLTLKAGDPFDRDVVENDIRKIHNLGEFKLVRYDFLEDGDQKVLHIEAEGKRWLEDYIRIGFALEDNFQGDSDYSLGVVFRKTGLNEYGAYAEIQTEIGKSPGFAIEYYQPLSDHGPYFIAPEIGLKDQSILIRDSGEVIAEYDRLVGDGAIKVGRELGSYGEMASGVRRGFGDLEREIGDPALRDFSYDIGEVFANVIIDTLDAPDFPREGIAARTGWNSSTEDLGASDDFNQILGGVFWPVSFGQNTLAFRGSASYTFEDLPAERASALGGFLNVSGFQEGELLASNFYLGSLLFYRQFSQIGSSLFGLEMFGGGSIEAVSVDNDIEELEDESLVMAGAVFLGVDTPLFPTYLGFGMNDESEHSFYLAVGRLKRD